MKYYQSAARMALVLACAGMVAPQQMFAAAVAPSEQGVRDLSLGANGTLTGQVVNSQGQAQAGAQVQVFQQEQKVASATADADGNFSVAGLRGGVHQIAAGEGVQVYRFWSANTAPPAATNRAMLVSDSNVVRGGSRGGVVGFLTNPWVLAAGVATAIAVPIALNNNNNHKSGS
jgi:hypothetical protein